jgi:hypothetical protein
MDAEGEAARPPFLADLGLGSAQSAARPASSPGIIRGPVNMD